ncbi:MAG: hypothetical protein GXP29_14900 [Planctomycetes bacterium]|nr:hypothetical protein [Planctomycetota bacterium]
MAKEWAKQTLSRIGHAKYALHASNRILTPSTLRDGSYVYEFLRCNPHWGGVSSHETAWGIGDVLTSQMLERLVEREGGCVLYTHLGKAPPESRTPLGASAVAGFRRLADAQDRGDILVTTTRRLLGYCRARREISFTAKLEGDSIAIDVDTKSNRYGALPALTHRDVEGLSFDTPDPLRTTVCIDGTPMTELHANAPDGNGKGSVSIPWSRLEFPQI